MTLHNLFEPEPDHKGGKVVLVCGGRDYDNTKELFRFLDDFGPIDLIVHGSAKGADLLAAWWAVRRNIEHKPYPADWKKHGRAAGPIRNKLIL